MVSPGEHLDLAAVYWRASRDNERRDRDALRVAVRRAVAAGMSESEAARRAGVTRMTVRAWLGKTR